MALDGGGVSVTPRERQLAAVGHELTDRASLDAIRIEHQDAIAAFLGIDAAQVHERLGMDGRLVAGAYCGPDHHLKPDAPPGNVLALYDAAREYRSLNHTL